MCIVFCLSIKIFLVFQGLQKLLQFPEEVAVLLTDTEARLFNQVPAADYVRQVTLDLTRGSTINAKVTGVEDLIHRFNEVQPCRLILRIG